jgi:LuxR family transcriptional regulator, maltose regulon positive regulatory protein
MAKSPTAAPERDVLLATKLHMPASRPDLVPRPRLTARLDEGLAGGLVLVCAPAGYGKTVLLADWIQRARSPAGWLSLDAGDNDPARFWRHAVAALDRARPGIGDRVAPLLGPPAPSSFQGLVTALINELAAEPGDVEALLVLDDYHVIGSRQVHESLAFLLEHRPARLFVVLAGRSDPPLPLARLRARGQLTELREAELRFTPAEAAELLQRVAPTLPDASVTALATRTEGWAAGLQLAALSLRGQDDAAAFVAAFTGSHRYVLDYLAEEVLERQDKQLRTFLLETSVLGRLSGPLCDAVTGRDGSQALLEEAERAGLFLIPLDEVRGWWRYHHLFADLLRARLQEEQPGRVTQLHRAAAAWYSGHQLADDAIGHATAAGEMLWAARIIEQHFDMVYNMRGEAATIHRWLSVLPADLVRSRPRLLLAQALMAATSGHLKVAEPLLDAVECAPPDWADEPFEPTVGVAVSLLINVPALTTLHRSYIAQLRSDAEATAAFATQALADIKPEERLLNVTAHALLAVAEWLRGRLMEAERAFASSVTGWRETGQLMMTAWGWYQLVLIQRAQGRLDAAVLTCQQALDTLVTSGRPLAAAGPSYAVLAEIAYQRDDLDLALRHVTEGIALCRQFVYTTPLANGLAALAMIRQATGDPAGALAAMTEAEQASSGPAGLLNPVLAQRARLLLAQGDLAGAARFAHDNGLGPDDEPDYARESGHLVLARILLAQDRSGQALALLDRLHAAAAAQDRVDGLIEAGALRALALAAAGDETGAVTALAEALLLACPQGYMRVFADEGPPMAALLGRLVAAQRAGQAAAGVPLGYLARLQRAFNSGQPAPDPVSSGIIDPLTGRELEVLRMLAAGRSNQAIARELVVTLDTVKKHVGHLLGKLGASNRTEAVARARELSLIP